MGNSQSNDGPKSPQQTSSERRESAGRGTSEAARHHSLSHASQRRQPHGKAPPAALAPASTTTTTSTTVVSVSASPKAKSHSRARSVTASTTPRLSAHDVSFSHKSDSAAMGNTDSKPQPRPPSRSNTLPIHSTPPRKAPQESDQESKQQATLTPVAQSDDAPPPSSDGQEERYDDDFIPGLAESPYGLPPANYSRPPRLPLPIEEEVHTPGSPIISPQDVKDIPTQFESSEIEGGDIPRKNSVLSSTTADDDEVLDESYFADQRGSEIRVPTKLEWNGGGNGIFVTGTFCNWEKKVKMHKNVDAPGWTVVLQLPPGTHHVKFLVDGDMYTSNQLPTTVDWTNSLVNYIEIVAPAEEADEKQAPVPAVPMPIPGAALTAGQAVATPEPASRPNARVPETEADLPSTLQESVGPKGERPGAEPPGPTLPATPTPRPSQPKPESKPTPAATKQKLPRPKYTNQIPDFLVDLDNYTNPEDERYQRAQRVASTLPQPPSLPMFLNKSILNGATPHKDDASVLIMPNHTVLNHLATSSIKSGVLATSGTTRYKRKFLTTIMYKPTSDDG